MSGKDGFSYGQEEAGGIALKEEILGTQSPLRFNRVLDPRQDRHTFLTTMQDSPEAAFPRLGEWVEKPQPGSQIVVKSYKYFDRNAYPRERDGLLTLQPHFALEDPARPVRLLGICEEEEKKPKFLLFEYISPPFNSIPKLVETNGAISPTDALDITIRLAGLLITCYEHRVVNWDLEGYSANHHMFADPNTHNVRIIDWGNTHITPEDRKYGQASAMESANQALGQVLYQMTTGERLIRDWYRETLEEQNIPRDLRNIIEKTADINSTVGKYPTGIRGTKQFARDLQALYQHYSQQGSLKPQVGQ